MAEDILFILNSRKKEKLCSALIDNISGPGDKKRENMSKLPAADRKPKFQCDGQRMWGIEVATMSAIEMNNY